MCRASGGSKQFKGSRKSTPFAAQMAADNSSLDISTKFIMKDSPCFIGIKKGNLDLLLWTNVFILHKTLGGDLNTLSEKWFGQSIPPLPTM